MPIGALHFMHPIGPGATSVGKILVFLGGDNEIDDIIGTDPNHRGDGQVGVAMVVDAAHSISLDGRQ